MAASSSERDSLPRMPFLQHLEALRSVLITALVVVGVGTLVAWPFAGRLLDFVIRLLPDDMPAHVFAPAEAFLIRLKVSAAAGLFAGAPIVLWKVWSFLAPALYRAERRRVSALFILSTLLFYAGTAFAYLVIITMGYFFRLLTDSMQMTIGVTQLFGVVAKLSVAFGVVFQLPLVIFLLTLLGLVSPRWLLGQWRVAIVLILVFSAVLTPPDVVSQLLMAGPLFLLYLVSAVVALLVERRKREATDGGSVDTPENL